MSTFYPAAYVDIYPAGGGSISLNSTNGAILSVTTFKDQWQPDSGSFEIILPPGGPIGDSLPNWINIISPMSLVAIGLQRSIPGQSRANIIMIGIVTAVEQDTEWKFGTSTRRVCRITGRDFSFFFSRRSAYCTTLLRYAPAGLAGSEVALALQGLNNGSPEELADTFYNTVMAGSGGIMAKTGFSYNGSKLPWGQLVQNEFQSYPDLPVTIPCSWNYLSIDGTWTDAFQSLLPWPWYEFTITTQSLPESTISIADAPFFLPASPLVLGRPLPLPRLTGTDAGTLDTSAWDALPTVTPDNAGMNILRLSQSYGLEDVRNFYILNPSIFNTLTGNSNQQITPWMYQYASWIDVDGIHNYGYSPEISNIYWFSDPTGNQAIQNAGSGDAFTTLVADLSLIPVSFYEPTPIMSHGTATLNLRPDIAPGVRFAFVGDKYGTEMLSYVRSVGHQFTYGGESTTTVGYCRGLPASVYADSDLLLGIHQGRGVVVDGTIVLTASGIGPFNQNTFGTDLESLATAFSTPGAQ